MLQSLQEVVELFDGNLRDPVAELCVTAGHERLQRDKVLLRRVELSATDVLEEDVTLARDVHARTQHVGPRDDVGVADHHLVVQVVESL